MKIIINTLSILVVLIAQVCKATDYYVSINGSNSANGLSELTAFKTVNYASTKANHGDTILVMPGIYTNDTYGVWDIWKTEQAVRINNKTSTSGNYLIIKPQIAGTVTFKSDGNFIFQIRNSSYIRIDGFIIEGERDNVSLATALKYQFTFKDSNGIIQERVQAGTPASTVALMKFPIMSGTTRPTIFNSDALIVQNSDHIDILNNTIHKSTSSGIRIAGSDYINIMNNIVKDCNQRTSIGTPALVLSLINSLDLNDNVKIVIARNKVFDNYNLVYSWNASKDFITPLIDEGKGISLEHCITRPSPEPSWNHGRVRIENNICYGNGLSGINTNEAERVDIVNNTCYQNIATGRGTNTGISINDAVDINVFNNISYSINNFGGEAFSIRNSSGVHFSNNLVKGTIDADVNLIDVATLFADPLFIDTKEFKLASNSQAINSSLNSVAPAIDFYGNSRDVNRDLGAVEYISNSLSIDQFMHKEFILYPNPARDFLCIKNNEAAPINAVVVYNSLGKNIVNFSDFDDLHNIKIDLSSLSKGFYWIKINDTLKTVIKN